MQKRTVSSETISPSVLIDAPSALRDDFAGPGADVSPVLQDGLAVYVHMHDASRLCIGLFLVHTHTAKINDREVRLAARLEIAALRDAVTVRCADSSDLRIDKSVFS